MQSCKQMLLIAHVLPNVFPQRANKWVTLANTGQSFDGHKPIIFMLDGGFPAIMRIWNDVEALREGL